MNRDDLDPELFDHWHHLVLGSIRTRTPEDAEEIAWRCTENHHVGRPTCTWHEAAAFYGTKCHCRRCAS